MSEEEGVVNDGPHWHMVVFKMAFCVDDDGIKQHSSLAVLLKTSSPAKTTQAQAR
jgi:hypothetical protein